MLLQCSHRCANVSPALTGLSQHCRDSGGTDSTRECCDNSVAALASHRDTLSLTYMSPSWSVSDNSQIMSRIHINTYKSQINNFNQQTKTHKKTRIHPNTQFTNHQNNKTKYQTGFKHHDESWKGLKPLVAMKRD